MTDCFVAAIGQFQMDHGLELVQFQKGQRKDDVSKSRLKKFRSTEGVVFIGVAQEKARVPRTIRKQFKSGATIPWIDYTTSLQQCSQAVVT